MSSPQVYYVSPTGNNTNGLSPGTAFTTIQQAANIVNPGDTVLIMDGTYSQTNNPDQFVGISRSGTATAPITFEAAPGAHPMIEFSGVHYGFQIGASYITIEGLDISGPGASLTLAQATANPTSKDVNSTAIAIGNYLGSAPSHVTIEDNTIHGASLDGIASNGADYLTIQNNLVYNNDWWSPAGGSGIHLYESADTDSNIGYKNYITGNIVYGNQMLVPETGYGYAADGNGINIDDNKNIQGSGIAYNGRTLIAGNLVYDNGRGGISAYESQHVDMINNTLYENNSTAASLLGPNPVGGSGQIGAQNSNDISMFNNISVARSGYFENTANASTNVTSNYNIYYGGIGAPVQGPNDRFIDPQFVNPSLDPTVANFGLNPTSPAIGSAILITPILVGGVAIAGGNNIGASQTPGTPTATPPSAAPTINALAAPTYNANPTLTGAAAANATVTIDDGTTKLGTVVANGSGAWNFTSTSALVGGLHSFTATATDAAGNTSPASAAVSERITTLVLQVAGDSWNGAPQYTVVVDGHQIGGTYSTAASHTLGQWDTVTLTGDFGLSGPQQVAINFTNDAYGGSASTDRNLYVGSLSVDGHLYNGASAADTASLGYTNPNAAPMLTNGTVKFLNVISSGDTVTTSVANAYLTVGGTAATKSSITVGATVSGTTINGGLGTDTFTAGVGYDGGNHYIASTHDTIDGFNAVGSCIDYSSLATRVTVNLNIGIGTGYDASGNALWQDTYTDVQQVKASKVDGNVLTGSDSFYCELKGGLGSATYHGGAAGDRIIWGSAGATGLLDGHGTDIAYGGSGNDEFYWRNSPGGEGVSNMGETINGFNTSQGDDLNLSEFAQAGFAGVPRSFADVANDLTNWAKVALSADGSSTLVQFDKTGTGTSFQTAATLMNDNLYADYGVTDHGSSGSAQVLNDLYSTGHLVLGAPH